MRRRSFIGLSLGAVATLGGGAGYLLSDRSNLLRADVAPDQPGPDGARVVLLPDEARILQLASLAPSGHNTQPWFVERVGPFHWILGNDSARWLPAVDPTQRETMLSLGAFAQTMKSAAIAIGYSCRTTPLAVSNQDERVLEVWLTPSSPRPDSIVAQIEARRTVRSPFLNDAIRDDDLAHLIGDESAFIRYLPVTSAQGQSLNVHTLEANHLQTDREPAQRELSDWIRFSNAEARQHRDGLTPAGMQIEGFAGWAVRNFYDRQSVMKQSFREQGLTKVRDGLAGMAGWLLITSPDASPAALLDAGRRLQRLWLKASERKIAIHPMTQILEEPSTAKSIDSLLGRTDAAPIQFLLRTGYVPNAPAPVSLRRPVAWFTRALNRLDA